MGTKTKRFLSMLLAGLMVVTTPVTAFAENGNSIAGNPASVEDSKSFDVVAKNVTTDEVYDELQEALNAAASGETIALTAAVNTMLVTVPTDVTLDLNGYTLTATYATSFGDIVDRSAENSSLLVVAANKFMILEDNTQLPVKTDAGYKFFEVIGFNTLYQEEKSRYVFQPLLEAGAHEWMTKGAAVSETTINVCISWASEQGSRTQNFVYTDEMVRTVLNSYDPSTGGYGQMFTLSVRGAEAIKDLAFQVVVKSDKGVAVKSEATVINTEEDIPAVDKGELSEDVTLDTDKASAVVAEGTKVDGETLALTTEEMSETTADIELAADEEMLSLNVHVDGVAKDNTVPVLITIDEIAPEYLNQGNITLYHVENGETVEMTRVYSLEEVDAHNEYYYDVLTGTITMALATFSEVAMVSETENGWNGDFDYDWYANGIVVDAEKGSKEYTIANADQLAAFGAIVGGMELPENIKQDAFENDIVKLLSDVNLGDAEDRNVSNKIFYPIGYYNNKNSYTRTKDTDVVSSVSAFKGTFDGNGHTISNFYQNTWEMFGDYNDGYSAGSNYYKDAMGLFGYVVNGTVKNLTVDNFSSDGEFTPTGVIAAYAENATFENIAITNCNPRVYNTGNGGIIGIAGRTNDQNNQKITLKNITVDNSNKISALWGSWDVACGGLVGMFRGNADGGNGTIHFENCHVSAQIDVYNDVCANYQYYAYRYAGMIIGSVRHNTTTTINGENRTIPNMTGISASNCTVNYGDWNDYYYCEFEKNSMASYSEDYQFSRVPHSELNFNDTNGNGVVDANERNSVTGCTHTHTEEENHKAVYLPFHQLFTGYSWGVSSIGLEKYSGIVTDLGITEGDQQESVKKFAKIDVAKTSYAAGESVTIGKLFTAIENAGVEIDEDNVQVSISPVGADSTVVGTYQANATDWTLGTLTFSGVGAAEITITDYYFCTETTLDVEVYELPVYARVGSSGGKAVEEGDVDGAVQFEGNYVNLQDFEFTFSMRSWDRINQYQVKYFFDATSTTTNYIDVYFDHRTDSHGDTHYYRPSYDNDNAAVTIEAVEGLNGYYTMKSGSRYLKLLDNLYYDTSGGNNIGESNYFEFFERDPGNITSGIYGYKKVILNWEKIKESPETERFLIAQKAADGYYYVMKPTKYEGSKSYQYVAQVQAANVEKIIKDVTLYKGSTLEFFDREGVFLGDTFEDDIAKIETSEYLVDSGNKLVSIDELVSGRQYYFENNRAKKYLSNVERSDAGMNFTDEKIGWTVNVQSISEDGTSVKAFLKTGNKYLNITNGDARLSTQDTETTLTYHDGYLHLLGTTYLNDHGGGGNKAAGYATTHGDKGSYWNIYEAPYRCTKVTFTGAEIGKTMVIIGNVAYYINVIDFSDSEKREENISMKVGSSITVTNTFANFATVNTNGITDPNGVVETAITGSCVSEPKEITNLEQMVSGQRYYIENMRCRVGKLLKNDAVENNKLALNSTRSSLNESGENEKYLWTIEQNGERVNGYIPVNIYNGSKTNGLTMGDRNAFANGTDVQLYLVNSDIAGYVMITTGTTVEEGVYVLNNDGGENYAKVAGYKYNSDDHVKDTGNFFKLYLYQEPSGSTEITFTGKSVGETDITIGNVIYHIYVEAE